MRLHAELFVTAPARDRATIRSFEAIALGFLPRLDLATLLAVARLVVPCEDTPASILDHLVQRSPETRQIVVRQAPRLPTSVISFLLGSARDRIALAARPDLDETTLGRLLVLGEEAVDTAVAANRRLNADHPAFERLLVRGHDRPAIACALLARDDLSAADEAVLYLAADAERRARILSRIAASAQFQRPHLPLRLTTWQVEQLLEVARCGDVPELEKLLSSGLGLPPSTQWRILEAGRHQLLALALRTLGVAEEDATRLFLTLHPALSHSVATVFGLVHTMRTVERATALALVEAILQVAAKIERPGRQPSVGGAGASPSQVALTVPERSARAVDDRQRRVS
jgi:hypothetical protein